MFGMHWFNGDVVWCEIRVEVWIHRFVMYNTQVWSCKPMFDMHWFDSDVVWRDWIHVKWGLMNKFRGL
jgi:hypothetical protein